MHRPIELLAPGGDIDAIKAAIAAGANAVYCGLNNFNARNRATNIELKDLNGILNLAHRNKCKVYLTLNIIIVESEFRALVTLLNKLVNTSLDGIIVQDLGLFYLLTKHFKTFEIHASTQLTTHNRGQIEFLHQLNAAQVNLCRELNLAEITELTEIAHKKQIKTEIFVHGSYCLSFSGLCYMSSVLEGKSGNRGRCSQPCRDKYLTTAAGKKFPLNLKDNSAYLDLAEISAAGVDSIKIEGRIKKFDYVYSVVAAWRDQLERLNHGEKLNTDYAALQKVFNREFSNAFLRGRLTKDMFIDNPRDSSAQYLVKLSNGTTTAVDEQTKQRLQTLRAEIVATAQEKIKPLNIEKPALVLLFEGRLGCPLRVTAQTHKTSFTIASAAPLEAAEVYSANFNSRNSSPQKVSFKALDKTLLTKKFNTLNTTEYRLQQIDLSELQPGLFLPSREITALKNRIFFTLNGGKNSIKPVTLPPRDQSIRTIKPTLSVLISSVKQVEECTKSSTELFFQLPSSNNGNNSELAELFLSNKNLTPWFPSILIGENYHAALDLLQRIKTKRIVTNNSGIAYEAAKQGIKWIAGPDLNLANSWSLHCLKETFNCSGAFISNELSQRQIAAIVSPDNFALYYSIFHPQRLMTSRQCLLQQIEGCEKEQIDNDCLQNCSRSTTLTNLKSETLRVIKTRGNYTHIYSHEHFFNPAIINDLPNTFSSFLIDLRESHQKPWITMERSKSISLFAQLLAGNTMVLNELKQHLPPYKADQYKNGI
jgi:putative protease